MKKVSKWLLIAWVLLSLPLVGCFIFVWLNKGISPNGYIAFISSVMGLLGFLSLLGGVGTGLYVSVKEMRTDSKEIRAGRWELARFKLKRRYPSMIGFVVVLVGLAFWGLNAGDWARIPMVGVLAIIILFGYYMKWADNKDCIALNKIRERHNIPLKTNNLSFWKYIKSN